MRKSHMQIVIDGLRGRLKDVEEQRDKLLTELHSKADAHTAAVGKLGTDISGLAESVRAAMKPPAAPEPEAAPEPQASPDPAAEPTPIAARRRSKAAG